MSRRNPVYDPQVERELAELDAALAGDPAADPMLALLAADVRAEGPRMTASFAARLDAQAEAGFPRVKGGPSRIAAWLSGLSGRGALLPAMGIAATMLVALVVVASQLGGSDGGPAGREVARSQKAAPATGVEDSTSGTGAADRRRALRAPSPIVAGGAATGAPAAGATTFDTAPRLAAKAKPRRPGFGRKVEKSTQLSLSTSADGVQETADGVVKVIQSLGGIVESSQVTTTQRGGTATFSLRVPVGRLDEAVRRLSALAHVSSLTQSVDDITGGFVSVASRLSDARAERRALLRALGRATTANQIASLRARLRINASEIASYKGELNALRRRADLARVELTVEGHGRRAEAGGSWTPGDALRDALRVLEVAAGVLLVGSAALLPVALLAALSALGARTVRRRRREQALDAAA